MTEQVALHYARELQDESVRIHLNLLIENTKEIETRLAHTPEAHVAELCNSLLKVLTDIRKNYLSPTKRSPACRRKSPLRWPKFASAPRAFRA